MSAHAPSAARGPRGGWAAGIGRGRLVALEAAAGAVAGGAVLRGAFGWTALVLAALALLVAAARRDGRWLTDLLAARLRGSAAASLVVLAPDPVPGCAQRPAPDLGAVLSVAPRLEVTERADRNRYPLGVAWDGQGFAAAVELAATAPLRLDLGLLAAQAADDDVGLAGIQLVVEQLRVPALDASGFGPAASYRRLAPDVPLVGRVWLALRYEPIWAPDAARRRGEGGADGARLALAAALGRLRVRLLSRGTAATPLDARALTGALRSVGDPAPTGELYRDAWVTGGRTHHCLAAEIGSAGAAWSRLLAEAAGSPADRTVISVAVDLDGRATRTRGAVRLVSASAATAEQARQQLLASGLASPLPGAQAAGILATLPLGGGPRPLVTAIGWVAS